MSRVREKALELAVMSAGYGLPVKDAQELLNVAEVFRAWIDPPEPIAADGDDYPRMQGVTFGGPGIPDRY